MKEMDKVTICFRETVSVFVHFFHDRANRTNFICFGNLNRLISTVMSSIFERVKNIACGGWSFVPRRLYPWRLTLTLDLWICKLAMGMHVSSHEFLRTYVQYPQVQVPPAATRNIFSFFPSQEKASYKH